MRVAAITPGRNVPSARFRVRQFVAPLKGEGVALEEMPFGHGDAYPPAAKWRRPGWAALRLASLMPAVVRSRQFDTVLLQREMISSFATLEGMTGKPRFFDVDDSIHLLRGGNFARKIAGNCDAVIAGNSYLAEWYSKVSSNVHVLPTAIDTARYRPRARRAPASPVSIGWIGTSANFPYLAEIEPALANVLTNDDVHLRVMADRAPEFRTLAPKRWSFEQWSEASEVEMLQSLDIGLMPLPDTPWTRGKCSFKMLQYMACATPVVVSPVGMNAQVLAAGAIGAGAKNVDEWTDALRALIQSELMRNEAGLIGRKVVEENYSVAVIAPRLAKILRG